MDPRWILLLLLLLHLPAACSSPVKEVPSLTPHEVHVPLPMLPRYGTYLVNADFAIAPDGTVHVISYITYGPDGAARGSNLYYHRGLQRDTAWQWTRPHRLPIRSVIHPRLLAAGRYLHVLSGHALQHLESDDGGDSWIDRGDLTQAPGARTFDAIAIEDTVVVMYTSWTRSNWEIDDSATLLRSIRAEPGKFTHRILIAFPGSSKGSPGPRLVRRGSAIHEIWAVTRGHTPGPDSARRPSAWQDQIHRIVGGQKPGRYLGVPNTAWRDSTLRLGSTRSDDGGRTWLRKAALPRPAWRAGRAGYQHEEFAYGHIAVSSESRGLQAVWSTPRLQRHHSRAGDRWERGTVLDSSRTSDRFELGLGAAGLAALSTARGDVVVWVTFSHEVWERGELPLTKMPSGNNDVYVAAFDERGTHSPIVRRLTHGLAVTMSLRAQIHGDTLYVLRAGYFPRKWGERGYDPGSNLRLMLVPLKDVFAP